MPAHRLWNCQAQTSSYQRLVAYSAWLNPSLPFLDPLHDLCTTRKLEGSRLSSGQTSIGTMWSTSGARAVRGAPSHHSPHKAQRKPSRSRTNCRTFLHCGEL